MTKGWCYKCLIIILLGLVHRFMLLDIMSLYLLIVYKSVHAFETLLFEYTLYVLCIIAFDA